MTAFEAPRKLSPDDSLEDFCCGVPMVDDWARSRAHGAERHGTAVVYVVRSGDVVAGLYSLSSHSVVREDVKGGWLKRNASESIPTILLGMLGVDRRFQGQHLGSSLLGDAIRRSTLVAEQIGARALLVDPVDDAARRIYEKYGFKAIPGMDRMFIPLRK